MIVLAPDFMTTIFKKAAQDFHRAVSKVFDRVKSVALWSANIRKLAKDHKCYGSAATWIDDMRRWPNVMYGDIYNYLISSKAVDGQ